MRAPMLFAPMIAVLMAVSPGAAAQDAPVWDVDHSSSRLGFVATQSGSDVEGAFADWSAEIAFDPATATGRVEVTIQTASVTTGSRDRDDSLKGDGLLHVAAHPEARFVAESFRTTGENAYEALGQLTLRGTTREEVLPFTLEVSGAAAEAAGELTLQRLDYGVGQGQWADTSTIGAAVRVVFEISAARR